MDSTTTIPLSTIIPNAIIKAARVTWFRPTPRRPIIMRVVMVTIGIRDAIILPVLTPKKINITNKTITID